jgi:hypothetical protein
MYKNDYNIIITKRDKSIERLGIALISPVKTLQWVLNIIRFFEFKTISSKIEILEDKVQSLP